MYLVFCVLHTRDHPEIFETTTSTKVLSWGGWWNGQNSRLENAEEEKIMMKSYGSLSKYVKNLYKPFERICTSHIREASNKKSPPVVATCRLRRGGFRCDPRSRCKLSVQKSFLHRTVEILWWLYYFLCESGPPAEREKSSILHFY